MKEVSIDKEIAALDERKTSISKKIIVGIIFMIISFSLLSFAFVFGYAGTFMLFK